MSKENTTLKAFTVLSDMALVMSDTQCVADIGDQQDNLKTLQRAFLCSDFADDNNLRNSVLVIMDQVKAFYKVLAKHDPDDVKAALQELKDFYSHAVLQE